MRTKFEDALIRKSQGTHAFTMIEVALAVAVVAFALVGIIGVLPTGIRVQKDNREDTVINQDGLFLLEAMRSSTRTLDELTNYVESIIISNSPAPYGPGKALEITNFPGGGEEIVGLLTTLKTPILLAGVPNPSRTFTYVSARMRSLSGNAGDKGNKTNEFAFRYLVTAETVPIEAVPPASIVRLQAAAKAAPANSVQQAILLEELMRLFNQNNYMFDVRLTLQWPMYQRGDKWQVGRFRRTFRTVVSGTLSTNTINPFTRSLTFLVPNTFTNYLSTSSATNGFFLPYAL